MKAKYIPDKGVPPMAELPEAENVDTGHVVRQYLDGEYDWGAPVGKEVW